MRRMLLSTATTVRYRRLIISQKSLRPSHPPWYFLGSEVLDARVRDEVRHIKKITLSTKSNLWRFMGAYEVLMQCIPADSGLLNQ